MTTGSGPRSLLGFDAVEPPTSRNKRCRRTQTGGGEQPAVLDERLVDGCDAPHLEEILRQPVRRRSFPLAQASSSQQHRTGRGGTQPGALRCEIANRLEQPLVGGRRSDTHPAGNDEGGARTELVSRAGRPDLP
ncbi:MAG: hypothetical protein R2710_05410 [Acidimicrobiales bacterium]